VLSKRWTAQTTAGLLGRAPLTECRRRVIDNGLATQRHRSYPRLSAVVACGYIAHGEVSWLRLSVRASAAGRGFCRRPDTHTAVIQAVPPGAGLPGGMFEAGDEIPGLGGFTGSARASALEVVQRGACVEQGVVEAVVVLEEDRDVVAG